MLFQVLILSCILAIVKCCQKSLHILLSFFQYFQQLFYVSPILHSSSSDLFSRTENLKKRYKAYYQEDKDTLSSTGKPGSLVSVQDTNFFGPCCRRIGYHSPNLTPPMSGRLPVASVPLLCTHSPKQSFPFASFETKQFP